MAHTEPLNYLWCALGTIFAIPGVAFIVATTFPRKKFANTVASVIGTILGYAVTLYIWGTPLNSVHIEGAVVLVGSFFISSVVGMVVALAANSLMSGGQQAPRSSQVEF
jgi:flagellar biosynthesis protein FliR